MIEPLLAENTLGVVFFPAFDWAISPIHPEREERLLYTRDQLHEEGLFDIRGITEHRPFFATHEQIERTHFCLPNAAAVTTESHLAAAGSALAAARLVIEKKEDKAFAMARPPGHHATRIVHGNRGFCNVNNEAVMIDFIRDNYPRPDGRPIKIAVVDTDVHHGDGSQDVFWNDPNTLFISLHQDGRTLYPGSGFLDEYGGPAATGKTINIPLPPETCDEGYLFAIRNAVLPMIEDFKPDLIINSAGQDNHFTDPLAHMRLSANGYATLTEALNPDIAVLEGGYSIRGALPYVNLAICLALAGSPACHEIREPDFTAASIRQSPKVTSYIDKLCDHVLDLYFHPPKTPADGRNEKGWWTNSRQIFYDTDMLREKRNERYRLCDECSGLHLMESASERVPLSLCVHLPRHSCEKCRHAAEEILRDAKKSGRYAHIKFLDGDNPVKQGQEKLQ